MDLRKKWVAALRSGKYEQTKNCLHDRKGGFCCLGVLCDMAHPGMWTESNDLIYEMEGEAFCPPPDVMRKVGMITRTGFFDADDLKAKKPQVWEKAAYDSTWAIRSSRRWALAHLNDHGVDFATIADIIEADPAGLFRE